VPIYKYTINTNLIVKFDSLTRTRQGQAQVFGDERFEAPHWASFDSGSPCLRSAVMSLECRLIRQIQESTHCLMIGEVISGRYDDMAQPLLYRDGQWVTTSEDLLMVPVEAMGTP